MEIVGASSFLIFMLFSLVASADNTSEELSKELDFSSCPPKYRIQSIYEDSEEIENESEDNDDVNDDEVDNWDVLIFTQQWPATLCYHWREENANHPCKLPKAAEFWTIHGIWPTKRGSGGPSFCNKSAIFDVNQLAPIEQNLEIYWPDIDGTSVDVRNCFWGHEWLKHGTCAVQLEALDNERKYFQQALIWRQQYNISHMFDSFNIMPDSLNTVVVLQTALQQVLQRNPIIHCVYDHKWDINYLSEIRLCFDKQLQLIDCDGVRVSDAVVVDYPGGKVITNCHVSKPVHYPSVVPPIRYGHGFQRVRYNRPPKSQHTLVNLYKLLQFVMWSTL